MGRPGRRARAVPALFVFFFRPPPAPFLAPPPPSPPPPHLSSPLFCFFIPTAKQLRKTLEEEFGVSLSERKEMISAEVKKEGGGGGGGRGGRVPPGACAAWSHQKKLSPPPPKKTPPPARPPSHTQIQAFLDAQKAAQPAADAEEEDADAAAAAEDEEDEDDAPPPAKKAKAAGGKKGKKAKAPGGMEPALSPELAAFVGAPRMHRFKIVKAIWAYIKAHGLQDPADKRSILPDAKLGTVLTAPVTMFSMNRQLNAHIVKEG